MHERGLPWGVQWEVARLVSRGHCTWKDISIPHLDRLQKEGSHDTPTVLNKAIAPYVEDLFRWNKKEKLFKPLKDHQARFRRLYVIIVDCLLRYK